jgi:signal transduction histidine kinase
VTFRRHSLVVRLLLLSIAAVVVPALLISFVSQSISSRALLKNIERHQTELARRIAEEVNGEIAHAQNMVALVARSSLFSAGSRVMQYEALRNLLYQSSDFQETMFVNASGQELLKVGRGGVSPKLVRRSEGFQKPYVGAAFFAGNRAPTILLGVPIRSFANPSRSGAIVAKMSFTKMGALLSQASTGTEGVAFIVDSKGMLLAHPEEKVVFAHANWSSLPVVRDWMNKSQEPTGLTPSVDASGQDQLSLAYPIPLLNSAVIIQQPKKLVYASLERMRQQLIGWTLLSVCVFLFVAIALSWRILKPLRKLRSAVEEVAQGKREIKLDIHTNDELEDLANTFEGMTHSLADLERMRRDLISMIVHDLKMPLATILPSLESLLLGDMGALSGEQASFVRMARRSAQEMLMLIQNLLDVARMEEGKMKLHSELFSPRDWASSVVSNFKPLAESGSKKLELDFADDLVPMAGDPPLLGRVLGNLISNALRHVPRVLGEVTIALYRDGTQLAVEVRDNGEGIPEEEQAHIFDKFVQGENQKAKVRTGTGLGLTFCKMVVEAHGGHITVYSQPKEGSVFTFRLPFQEAAPALPEPAIK